MPESNVIKKSALSPTVLIVGGAGFIGSHLSEALLNKDARVIVVDNFSTGKDIYVHNLLENPKFALFNVDINTGLPKEIQSVDYVFQLAGLETYLFDKADVSLDSLLTNALGMKNILDFVNKSEAKMLLGSTVDVYKGMISPLNLDNYFGQTPEEEKKYSLTEAKRYAEALVWEYYKKHNIDVRIARLPEVFGPRMNLDSSGSLGFLIKQLVENNDLIVYGDGVEKEYYIYISDAIAGLVKSLFTEGTKGKIYSFVGSEAHTILETTYLVKSLANSEARVVFKPKPPIIQAQEPRIPDLSTLKELNWEEKTTFRDGIIKTLKWLHYEPNEHAFKPGKLLDQAEVSRAGEIVAKNQLPPEPEPGTHSKMKDSIFSIIDLGSDVSKEASYTPQPPPIARVSNPPSYYNRDNVSESIPQEFIKPRQSSFSQRFKSIFPSKKKKVGKLTSIPNSKKGNSTGVSLKITAILLIIFALLSIFIGIPILQTYLHTKKGVGYLETVKSDLYSLDTVTAQDHADLAFKEFYRSKYSLEKVSWVFDLFGQETYIQDLQSLLNSAENTSKAVYFMSKGTTPMLSLMETIKPNSDQILEPGSFETSRVAFSNALNNLRLAEAELQQVDVSRFPPEVSKYEEEVSTLANSLDTLLAVTSDLDYILGLDGKRKYLVLFQNSNELRPTGGFIGSYAVLDLEKGKMTNLLIDDVYNPDGQIDLREIAETPPEPISTYLGEEVLHIRNANWNPDFTESAKDIEELFFKIDGRQFDGVIALDLHFVESLLNVTGPIYLAAYNEEINASNLYERAQFHSEFNYENGSDQKRSFLTVLGGKMLEKLFSIDQNKLFTLSNSLSKSLEGKHLLINIPDSSINAYLEQEGWNGTLLPAEDSDYLYVVNSNVGGTKANYYIENSMSYNILSVTRDGLLRGVLDLDYKHTGLSSSWPGGPYTDYVRVLTQRGSKLTGAKLTLDDGTVVDVFDSVTVSKVGKYNSFEFAFILDPQKSARLTFEYDLSKDLSVTKDNKSYSLVWQKQPGTANDNINFQFNAPFGTMIKATSPQMVIGTNSANFNSILDKDTRVNIQLQ